MVYVSNRGIYFIYLNVNSLLPKKEEMQHVVELTHASIVGISGTKFDGPVLKSEL